MPLPPGVVIARLHQGRLCSCFHLVNQHSMIRAAPSAARSDAMSRHWLMEDGGRQALDLVKEHVRTIMGPASVAFSNAMVKMSRLQAAQVRIGLSCQGCSCHRACCVSSCHAPD